MKTAQLWGKVNRLVRTRILKDRVLLVGDRSGWIIDEVVDSLRTHLPREFKPVAVADEWRLAKQCIIHFIHRSWAWTDGLLERVHPSNRMVGLWWHGRLDSQEVGIQAALERVRRDHPQFARMQVTCRSGWETMLAVGVPEEKLVLLPEGVDLRLFHPPVAPEDCKRLRAKLGVPRSAVAVGCFQKDGDGWGEGLEPKLIKGPDILVAVLERLNRQYPVHAVIPGPSRGYVKQRLDALRIPYSAPGFLPRQELAQCYHALDLYLAPARDEGGPAGVLEGMASGVAVISTRTGMPADIIENGTNGFLAEVDDVEGLVKGATALIEQPGLRQRVVRAAQRTIQTYDWSVLAQRYVDELYRPVGQSP